ncbi:MAG: type I glyceraldehyde-3-phosphate dehydrogenase [Candidatus Thermoplasmatota archaeon]|nr:type I glyceraldehyde-3-phosphate dehydrogenase [Candidatus Thermoplasmatota archaeon]
MAPARIAVNGFGRIGRLTSRVLLGRDDVELVAVNDVSTPEMLAHLFTYDSVHGTWPGDVEQDDQALRIDGHEVRTFSEPDPGRLPWEELEVDLVVECSGKFRARDALSAHLKAGAAKALLSAPGKGMDLTVVRGVNHEAYDAQAHHLVSNASCTTNCLAPVLKVLHETHGVDNAVMTTIHAYTGDQRLLDAPHKDLRRARAAPLSMIPTTTGAARAIGLVLPELDGRVDGMAVRVPTPNVSLVDLTARLDEATDTEQLQAAFQQAERGSLSGILRTEARPLVSVDLNHDAHSAVVDLPSLMVVDDSMAKVLAWYDNEWGYANRTAEQAAAMFQG